MATAKEVLNELKWRDDRDFNSVKLTYIHRGAPGDVKTIDGADILELGKSFFETSEAMIPYHRITIIYYEGEELWKRKKA
jgi:uncharacterized protein (UPF0248 family)